MALLDSLLGGNDQSSLSVSGAAAANPTVDLHGSDVLHLMNGVDTGLGSVATDLTGIGDLGLGVQAPVAAATEVDSHGGLLSGLL